jgi:uncharacterized protein (TIRG00374 family)
MVPRLPENLRPESIPALRRAVQALVILLALGAAVHVLLAQITTIENSARVLRSLSWWAVGLALVAQCFCYLCHGVVVRLLLRLFGQALPLWRSIAIVMSAYSLSMVWGGQFTNTGAMFRWLRAAGITTEASLVTGLAPALLNTLSFGALAAFGLAVLFLERQLPLALVAIFGAALLLLVSLGIGAWWCLRHPAWLNAAVHAAVRRWAGLRRRTYDPGPVNAAVDQLLHASRLLIGGRWRGPVVGDFLSAVFDLLTLYMLFLATGHAAAPGLVIAGYGLPILAGKLSVIPGGVGIIEGGMAGLYSALGVPGGVIVVVILGYRLISFWIPVCLGFLLVPVLNLTTRWSTDVP